MFFVARKIQPKILELVLVTTAFIRIRASCLLFYFDVLWDNK